MDAPDWTCTIDEGAAGLVNAKWTPDGRHIMTWADFQVRLRFLSFGITISFVMLCVVFCQSAYQSFVFSLFLDSCIM